MKRELDDEWHELFGDEMRELWLESCQEFCAVGLLVGLPSTGSIKFLEIGVRPVSVVILRCNGLFNRSQNRTRAKE